MARAPVRRAWDVPLLTVAEVSGIKAMAAAHPQAWSTIVEKICGLNRVSFAAGGEDGRRETDFAEGMRFVAFCLRNAAAQALPTPVKSAPPPDLPNSPTPKPADRS